jgi:hypothetical protein
MRRQRALGASVSIMPVASRFLSLQRAERVDQEVVSGQDAAVRAAEGLKRDPPHLFPRKEAVSRQCRTSLSSQAPRS